MSVDSALITKKRACEIRSILSFAGGNVEGEGWNRVIESWREARAKGEVGM